MRKFIYIIVLIFLVLYFIILINIKIKPQILKYTFQNNYENITLKLTNSNFIISESPDDNIYLNFYENNLTYDISDDVNLNINLHYNNYYIYPLNTEGIHGEILLPVDFKNNINLITNNCNIKLTNTNIQNLISTNTNSNLMLENSIFNSITMHNSNCNFTINNITIINNSIINSIDCINLFSTLKAKDINIVDNTSNFNINYLDCNNFNISGKNTIIFIENLYSNGIIEIDITNTSIDNLFIKDKYTNITLKNFDFEDKLIIKTCYSEIFCYLLGTLNDYTYNLKNINGVTTINNITLSDNYVSLNDSIKQVIIISSLSNITINTN